VHLELHNQSLLHCCVCHLICCTPICCTKASGFLANYVRETAVFTFV
jgi:hypothetical protein